VLKRRESYTGDCVFQRTVCSRKGIHNCSGPRVAPSEDTSCVPKGGCPFVCGWQNKKRTPANREEALLAHMQDKHAQENDQQHSDDGDVVGLKRALGLAQRALSSSQATVASLQTQCNAAEKAATKAKEAQKKAENEAHQAKAKVELDKKTASSALALAKKHQQEPSKIVRDLTDPVTTSVEKMAAQLGKLEKLGGNMKSGSETDLRVFDLSRRNDQLMQLHTKMLNDRSILEGSVAASRAKI
jgi:hypothetical protein